MVKKKMIFLILVASFLKISYAAVCGFEEIDRNHCHRDLDATQCEAYALQEGLPFYADSLGSGGDLAPYGCIKVSLSQSSDPNPPSLTIVFNVNAVAN
jgi:hypothetical protein